MFESFKTNINFYYRIKIIKENKAFKNVYKIKNNFLLILDFISISLIKSFI